MTQLRFVHAADLHLDSPFTGMRAEAPSNVADALYSATFDAYDNIIDLCISESVDALLVAGDIYDNADRSLRASVPSLTVWGSLTKLEYARLFVMAIMIPSTAGRRG